jgi:hypothetical protein
MQEGRDTEIYPMVSVICRLLELAVVARKPTGVNGVDSRVTREMANSSINQASHGHCAGVFIGT